ncbi:MAG: DUF1552 domain-containing protein, partial [Myxococcota bacterium]
MMEPLNYVPSGIEPDTRDEVLPTPVTQWPAMFDRLSPFHARMAFVDGMRNHIATHQHRAGTSALSCVNPTDDRPERMGPAGGPTIDQVIAREIGRGRPHRSVLWGITGDAIRGERRISSGVFAAGREQNLSHFTHAGEMMDSLFPDPETGGPAPAPFRPLRDRLVEDLGRLRQRLAPEERIALERYEAAIVEFDERQTALAALSCTTPPPVPTSARENHRRAEDHLVSMMSQSALALQCGLTNVVAVTVGTSSSHNNHMIPYAEVEARYAQAGVSGAMGFYGHGASPGDPRAMTTRRLWHETHFREISRLLRSLEQTREADGSTAADHTLVAYVSGNAKTNAGHHANKLKNNEYWPGFVIAGAETAITGGSRYLKFRSHGRGSGGPRNLS